MALDARKVRESPFQALATHLFEHGYGYVCVVSALRPKSGGSLYDWQHRYFDVEDELGAAEQRLIDEAVSGREVYFCAHLLKEKRRMKAHAAESVHALWADGDTATIPEGFPPPTAVVETSPGRYHYYWRLIYPVPCENAEDLNKRIAHAIGADPSGYDLTQLLRPPGFVNLKYADTPEVRLVFLSNNVEDWLDPEDLDRRLPRVEHPGAERKAAAGILPTDVTALPASGEPPVRLSTFALEVWRGEHPAFKDDGEIDRSKSLLFIGRMLYDAGGTRDQIVAALRERDTSLGWRKYSDRPDADDQYHGIVDELERTPSPKAGSGAEPDARGLAPTPSRGGDAGRLKILTDDDLDDLPPPTWLIDGILPEGSLALVYGKEATNKTFLAIDMALSVASGHPWHGREVAQGSVVYLAGEGARGLKQRRRAWKDDRQVSERVPFHVVPSPMSLLTHSDTNILVEELVPYQPILVVIDTLARYAVGGDENAAKDMGVFIGNVERLRQELGASVLIVHHSDKAGTGARGSGALTGAVDTVMRMMGTGAQNQRSTLTCEKQKEAEWFERITFERRLVELTEDESSCVLDLVAGATTKGGTAEPSPAAKSEVGAALDRMWSSSNAPVTTRALMRETGLGKATVTTALKDLKEVQTVEQVGKGKNSAYTPGPNYFGHDSAPRFDSSR